jgi:hypothetical protein
MALGDRRKPCFGGRCGSGMEFISDIYCTPDAGIDN